MPWYDINTLRRDFIDFWEEYKIEELIEIQRGIETVVWDFLYKKWRIEEAYWDLQHVKAHFSKFREVLPKLKTYFEKVEGGKEYLSTYMKRLGETITIVESFIDWYRKRFLEEEEVSTEILDYELKKAWDRHIEPIIYKETYEFIYVASKLHRI